MNIEFEDYKLLNTGRVNVILGKNGSGKSTILKEIEKGVSELDNYNTVYVTPERAGKLLYNANIENSIRSNPGSIDNNRRQNQWNQFKEHSVTQFRQLELLSLREIESNDILRQNLGYTFQTTIDKINSLLDNIWIERDGSHFKTRLKSDNSELSPAAISSGESELISLAIETLRFQKELIAHNNVIFIDEPDVHLHPDLQFRFGKFLQELISGNNIRIVIATHSTSFLGTFRDFPEAKFGLLEFGQKEINFRAISEKYKRIIPIFGAHPLSNLFNENPIFLIEGDDDFRIWNQAIRTSEGTLKIYPCSVDGLGNFSDIESDTNEIITKLYDEAKAYSIRDLDEAGQVEIDDIPPLIRFRLHCRTAENLLLSDEVLAKANTNWDQLRAKLETWIAENNSHPRLADMKLFRDQGFQRKVHPLKNLRNILLGLMDVSKPWEVLIGQVIGSIKKGEFAIDLAENKICNYLSPKLTNAILR